MPRSSLAVAAIAVAAIVLVACSSRVEANERPLAHMVFFTLAEDTPEHRDALIGICHKYLSGHEGAVHFSVGSLADDLNGEVNDRAFHVALHLVFASKAAHDKYQTHERHLKFVAESKPLWSNVRVFDSYLPAPEGEAIPARAQGFSGMIRGTVVATGEGRIIVKIADIVKVWKPSKAEDPNALVGKSFVVTGRGEEGMVARFLGAVRVGESVELDVADREGDVLTILELSQAQRDRVRP